MGDDPFMRNQNAAVRGATKGQNRTNVLQLKMMGQAHPTGLTPTLLKLFEARPPLEFKPPPEKRKMPSYAGIAQFVSHFAEKADPEYAPPVPTAETPAERKARIHKLRLEEGAAKAAEELEKYDPSNDPNVSGDPYKTLFVARLNYETSESKVKREFESYGPIKRVGISRYTQAGSVRLVTDKETGKPRGYAFIEYVHTRDMKGAYKQADGRKIDGRRVLVDVERGRTVPNWRPRRLGGGLGTSRVGGEDVPQRDVQQTGRSSQSAEPRPKEDRHSEREREKSRERGREREREREKSHERPKDREREDRHHKDRGKEKERDRDREHRRDGERDRDRDRGRERDRGRDRGRDKERDRDRDLGQEHDRGHYRGGRDREYEDYGDNERERSRDRRSEKDYDQAEPEDGRYEQHYESDRHDNRYDQMDEDDYRYDRGASESRDYRHSERSRSREYGI